MSGLQKTYNVAAPNSNRADFHRSDFETLIQQKGRNVILERSLQCSCKGKSTNQQSNCKNCGGTGWIFYNPKVTRMILQGMNITPDFKAWSEEIKGDLKVTASDTEELTFMDRITVLDAKAIFNEVLNFKLKGDILFAYSAYKIKEVLYMGYFQGTDQVLLRLNNNVDYTFQDNIVKIINPDIVAVQGQISVSIRYFHAPAYYMVEMKRESMESFELLGAEKLIHLPISGTARRAHYILDASNLAGDRILSNSFNSIDCSPDVCVCSSQSIVLPSMQTQAKGVLIAFTNQNSISINHNYNRYVSVTIYDGNDLITDGTVERIDDNNVTVTFSSNKSGHILIL